MTNEDVLTSFAAYLENPEQLNWFLLPDFELGTYMDSSIFVSEPLPFQRNVIVFPVETTVPGKKAFSALLVEDEDDVRVITWFSPTMTTDPEFYVYEFDQGQIFTSENMKEGLRSPTLVSKVFATVVMFLSLVHKKREVQVFRATGSSSNAKRIKKGKKPLFSWTEVTLKDVLRERREHMGGTHASPRQHERRGHWRNLASGKRVWIKPMIVGNIKNGRVAHRYTFEEAR